MGLSKSVVPDSLNATLADTVTNRSKSQPDLQNDKTFNRSGVSFMTKTEQHSPDDLDFAIGLTGESGEKPITARSWTDAISLGIFGPIVRIVINRHGDFDRSKKMTPLVSSREHQIR